MIIIMSYQVHNQWMSLLENKNNFVQFSCFAAFSWKICLTSSTAATTSAQFGSFELNWISKQASVTKMYETPSVDPIYRTKKCPKKYIHCHRFCRLVFLWPFWQIHLFDPSFQHFHFLFVWPFFASPFSFGVCLTFWAKAWPAACKEINWGHSSTSSFPKRYNFQFIWR